MYADPAKVHPIGHDGRYFRVPGLHLCEPSPQRTPVLYQAGASGPGKTFAAQHAGMCPRQPQPHPVEGLRQLPELVPAVIHDRLVEIAGGNALGRAFQPPNPAREHGCGAEACNQGDAKRGQTRPEEARFDEIDVLKRRAQRGREEQDVAGAVGHRHLGVLVSATGHTAPLQAQAFGRSSRHRIALDIPRKEQMAGVEDRQENASRERPEVHDPRVRPAGSLIDEILAWLRVFRLLEHASGRARELRQPPGDKPALPTGGATSVRFTMADGRLVPEDVIPSVSSRLPPS